MAPSLKTRYSLLNRSVIFDLDGTLIDSQESILGALRTAINESCLDAIIPLSKELIGPPLADTLSKITAVKDSSTLKKVVNKFKRYYDKEGYKKSMAYPGIEALLTNLYSQGYALYVATNKRLIPTRKIIGHFSWDALFSAVYTIDLNSKKPFKNKSEMIHALLVDRLIDPKTAVYVGDRLEDYEAAKSNGLRCILVNWGYGEIIAKNDNHWYFVGDPDELLNALQSFL